MPRFARILFATVACLLFANNIQAATMYVAEFTSAPPVFVAYQAAKAPALNEQTVAIGGGSLSSTAFTASTGLIRVHCDIICNVKVGGTAPTATTSTMRLTAGQTEYFVVTPGDKVAVIAGT